MPSYRCSLEVRDVRAGHAPQEVMEAAVAGVDTLRLVEAHGLEIERGKPVITVRFLVEPASADTEDALAWAAARAMALAVDGVATQGALRLTRRVRGRWLRVWRPAAS